MDHDKNREITESIRSLLGKDASFYQIEIREAVTSTNDLLCRAAEKGGKEGMVLIAREQTAGKGRSGRRFFSPSNSGLYMSILLRPRVAPSEVPLLTPMAAVAVAMAIEAVSGREVGIKWVNDIFLDGKKICGILTEGAFRADSPRMDYAVVGIGVNLLMPPKGFPEELKAVAGALWEEGPPPLAAVAAEILRNFKEYYDHFEKRTFLREYKRRLFFLGREIEILLPHGTERGIARDITEDCHLIVKTDRGRILELDSGEIRIRL